MVPIITHRDERKLFTVIAAIVIAALISLAQLQSARTGKPSAIAIGLTTAIGLAQMASSAVSGAVVHAGEAVASIPSLGSENARLIEENRKLTAENARLLEAISRLPDANAIAAVAAQTPGGIVAQTVGYDPESETRLVTIDRGGQAGVTVDAAVINADGAVGRVVQTTPLFSKVLLLTDAGSKIPALLQRGRWWGIAEGNQGHIELRYITQDAVIRIGDLAVTADGRSFHTGVPLGTVRSVVRAEGGLYQTAVLEPAVQFGRLGPVVVVPR